MREHLVLSSFELITRMFSSDYVFFFSFPFSYDLGSAGYWYRVK